MWSLESKGKLTLEVTEKLDRKLSTLLDVHTIYGDKGNQKSHQLQLLGGQSISIIDLFIKDAYKKKKEQIQQEIGYLGLQFKGKNNKIQA